jgi:hypothetical protein
LSKNLIKATPIAKDFSPGFASLWLGAILVMFFISLHSVSRDGFNQKAIGVLVVFSPLLAFGFWMNRRYIAWWLQRFKRGAPSLHTPAPLVQGGSIQLSFVGIPESLAREGIVAALVAEKYSEGSKSSPSWTVCLRTRPVRVYTQRDSSGSSNTFSGQSEVVVLPTQSDCALLPILSVRWSIELTPVRDSSGADNVGYKFALPKEVSQPLR